MTIALDEPDRRILSIEEDNSVGNSIQFGVVNWAHLGPTESLHVEIDNPWSGDTETGFGQTASINVSKPDAKRLANFLLAWINT